MVRRTLSRRSDGAPKARRFNWPLLGKVALGGLVVLLVVGLVPPLRSAAAAGISRTILFVASPLAPDIADLRTLPETSKVVAADGSVLAELSKDEKRVNVKVSDLPDHVKRAVLAAEDEDFYRHRGVDPDAVFRAFLRTARGQTQGGSTITQQVAKINYTARERTVLRKLKEVLYASQLEKRYSKDELLERYLNQVYFGEGAYGINAAAQTFFAVDAGQLTPAQAATLAGKIRAPSVLDPRKRPDEVTERRNQVLANMREEKWLKPADFDAARREPLTLAPPRPPLAAFKAPHFVEYVKREAKAIEELGGDPDTRSNRLFTGGYTIETTLDPKVFDASAAAVQKHLGQPGDPITATATVVPGDGAILSLFGGLDFSTTQFDVSSLGARQPGSAFKPFVYLAALRDGIDPRSTFDGTSGRRIPCYGDRPVNNYAGEDFSGQIDVDSAMVKSVNVVFVELGCKAGVRDVVRAAVDDGVPEDATKAQGAVFLGGLDKGVSALTMASAYATFTARGVYAEPYAIRTIKDPSGRVVFQRKPSTRPVFKAEEVGVLNNPLQRVVKEGTGKAAAIGRPVAGKTGTAQDNRDAWFVGYVPQMATAVWVGYEPIKPMSSVHGRAVTGGSFPSMIFADLMKASLAGVPAKPIPTASPDQLDLTVNSSTSSTSSTTSSSTTTSSTTSSVPPGQETTTTTAGGRQTTTTTAPPTTTTTARRSTTTTSSTSTSTTSTTLQSSSAGSSTTTSTTTQ